MGMIGFEIPKSVYGHADSLSVRRLLSRVALGAGIAFAAPFVASETIHQVCERTAIVPAVVCLANNKFENAVSDAVLSIIPELPDFPIAGGGDFDPNSRVAG